MNLMKKFKLWRESLSFKLSISALLMVMLILPTIAYMLKIAFEDHIKNAIERELSAYSYSILAVSEVEEGQLLMPEALVENQFNISQSGLYALITQDPLHSSVSDGGNNEGNNEGNNKSNKSDKVELLWSSDSLLGYDLSFTESLNQPNLGQAKFTLGSLSSQVHWHYRFSVSYDEPGLASFPYTVHIFKDQSQFKHSLTQFEQQVWRWLWLILLMIIVIQILWLKWTLKPLNMLKTELADVEKGKLEQLSKRYPLELIRVTRQVNTLLATEAKQRSRYRNSLADLAHSLKNPLAIIASDKTLPQHLVDYTQQIDQMIERQLKRAQSAGDAAWHLGTEVKPICDKLLNSLDKIYHHKHIDFEFLIDDGAMFKGDKADLMELLGNLLDNACKATLSSVSLSVHMSEDKLVFIIEDDGPGLDETQKVQILQRGQRADTYDKGHGIGLAIVKDLVESYQGELNILDSEKLGGAFFRVSF